MHGAQFVGVLFILLQLFSTETAGIGAGCIYFVPVLGQFHHGVGGVETSAECYYDFLLAHTSFILIVLLIPVNA